jgi:SAM-dependent methyltransferase
MKFKDYFSDGSCRYAKFRPRYGRELFAHLASRVPETRLAWDCATGSGQAAVPLTEFFDRVIATDASEEQIRNAAAEPRIEYRVAPAEDSGLEPASCDLITVAQALHWFDLARFYAEANRVLKPRGIMAVWNYNLLRIAPAIDAIVNRFYSETVGPFWPPERRMVEAGYRGLPFPFTELDAPKIFITAEWSADDLLGYLGTWSASQKYRQAHGEDPVGLVAGDLRQAWPQDRKSLAIRWPLQVRIGRKL